MADGQILVTSEKSRVSLRNLGPTFIRGEELRDIALQEALFMDRFWSGACGSLKSEVKAGPWTCVSGRKS